MEMRRVSIETQPFTESARELRNPNRGFYHVYPVPIADEGRSEERRVGKE